ncbi:hypothetical protein C1645_875432 [Glomus cerebriforme]|uniref:Uncharacterized protein n=1 Tax=Glomus cerebriforme TaxID=658196 RepID=A0A397T8R7_9GLOM|nr:hypothetical protein C1645_875432 [Glomus cerebriforme]
MMAGLNEMGLRGSFSYFNNKIYVMVIDNNTELRIESLAGGTSRLYFEDMNGNEVAAPNGFVIADDQGIPVQGFIGIGGTPSFFLTWITSYTLSINGRRFASLTTQKQQAVELNVAHQHYVDE